MAEYIEREKAFKLIKEQKEKETGAYSKGRNKGLTIAGSIINNKEALSTADVVEVVRCENCEYWQDKNSKGTQGICLCGEKDMNYGGEFYPFANDFCSYGKPRTPKERGVDNGN